MPEDYDRFDDAPCCSTATYVGEELEVHFEGTPTATDLGVPRSPTIIEINDIRITSVVLLEHDIPLTCLSEDLKTTLLALSDEVDWPQH